MMHYIHKETTCEYCADVIGIGQDVELTSDGLFCDYRCVKDHLYNLSDSKDVTTTNDKIYRSVD